VNEKYYNISFLVTFAALFSIHRNIKQNTLYAEIH